MSQTVTYSAEFAEIYDLLYDDPASRARNASTEAFLLDRFARGARRMVRDVLDLAAGTGAQTLPLLRHGFHVRAQDASPGMLDRLRRRLDQQGLSAQVVERRMQDTEGEGQVDAVVCCFTAFSHLLETADQRACLAAAYRVLRPGGLLVLDVANFFALLGSFHPSVTKLLRLGDRTVESVTQHDVRAHEGRWIHRQLTRITEADGTTRSHLEELPMRLVSRGEMELLLEETGFEHKAFAGYSGKDPFHLVFTCLKPGSE
jgi:ubiquinone/menaquinone biosynthesis C-methylase UbiE